MTILHCYNRYKDRCVERTCFSNQDVAAVTGHINPNSVERYNRKRRDTEFEEISQALHFGNTAQHVQIQQILKRPK